MASEIIGLSGCGCTFIWSTMARIGLLVRAAMRDMGTGAHAPSALADAAMDSLASRGRWGRVGA
jgi:hypothetical protein